LVGGGELINDSIRHTLRMTGLSHDVGHGVMSHVIENALMYNEEVEELRQDFRTWRNKDGKSQLSEMAAFFMISSPAFGELIAQVLRISDKPGTFIDPQQMARAVLGEKMDDSIPLLHELISGPFDADKMDYMPRDAKMSGVPVVTDFTRLIQKVRAVSVANSDLPEQIARTVEASSGPHVIIGIARSGASTLDEVALGRSLMFDKIYRHHKVRAAEAMVATISEHGLIHLTENPAMIPLALNDEQLLDLDSDWLKGHAPGKTDSDAVIADFEIASDVASRMRNRELFVRAFAFASVLPDNGYKGDLEQRAALDELIRSAGDAESRPQIIQSIADTVVEIAAITGNSQVVDSLPGGNLAAYISIDPPANKTIDVKPDPSRAYLIDTDGKLLPVEQINADLRAWADAYINVRDLGYVFCPRELSDLVHVATEVVFREMFGLRIPHGMRSYAKHNESNAIAIRDALFEAKFYIDKPRDLEPAPRRLRKADIPQRLAKIRDRFAGYSGPIIDGQEAGKVQESRLSDGRILDWAAQFPDDLVDCALTVLENVRFIGRTEMNAALTNFAASYQGSRPMSIVPLGGPKDGSAIMSYYSGDNGLGWKAETIENALISDAPIVFVDDFIGTGRSATGILYGWLDKSPPEPLNETRPPLPKDLAERLANRPLSFVFTTSLDDGKPYLEKTLADAKLTATVFSDNSQGTIPSLDKLKADFPKLPWFEFQEFCKDVGLQTLKDGDPKHDDDWRKARALGYGNLGLLLVSAFNTPTATLTAIWAQGKYAGRDWAAVFPRRPKH
jgi:HD superfamily phosphohydrolase